MKNIVAGVVCIIILLVLNWLLETGIITALLEFIEWYVLYEVSDNGLNNFMNCLCKILVFPISFSMVGWIFNELDFFHKDIMKISYFIVSTAVTILLTAILKEIQEHIVFYGVIAILLTLGLIFNWLKNWINGVLDYD